MRYDEIVSAAMRISDRTDDDGEVLAIIDTFFRLVESRVNKLVNVQEQTRRAVMVTDENQEYFGLPFDFSGLRDIEVKTSLTDPTRYTPGYLSPEQMNNHVTIESSKFAYTIIDGQIQLNPTTEDCVLEIVYYAKLLPLDAQSIQENWLSIEAPDIYIFGLLVEISSFVRDSEAAGLWDSRFIQEIQNMNTHDQETRWSGTALQIKLG